MLAYAGYKAGGQYLSAAVRESKLRGFPISKELEEYKSFIHRSLKRGTGESKKMLPITSVMLERIQSNITNYWDAWIFALMVVEWFFLLRSFETLLIGPEDITFCQRPVDINSVMRDSPPSVTLRFSNDKTDITGTKMKRIHKCVCPREDWSLVLDPKARPRLCPVHSLQYLFDHNVGGKSKKLRYDIRYDGVGYDPLLRAIRRLLQDVGVTTSDEFGELFGSHSLRRGGAQALARAGWSIDLIKAFGRWLSDAIEVYLLEVPLESFGGQLAESMLKIGIPQQQGIPSFHPTSRGFTPGSKVAVYMESSPMATDGGWFSGIVLSWTKVCQKDLGVLPLPPLDDSFAEAVRNQPDSFPTVFAVRLNESTSTVLAVDVSSARLIAFQ